MSRLCFDFAFCADCGCRIPNCSRLNVISTSVKTFTFVCDSCRGLLHVNSVIVHKSTGRP